MRAVVLLIQFLSVLLVPMFLSAQPSSTGTFEISNALINVVIGQRNGVTHESYSGMRQGKPILLLESGSSLRPDPAWSINRVLQSHGFQKAAVTKDGQKNQILTLTYSSPLLLIVKTITLAPKERFARIAVTATIKGAARFSALQSTYSFIVDREQKSAGHPLDFVYTPQLRPEPEQVIADHVFRSPAFMMQKDERFVGLIPDLAAINQKYRRVRTTGDLQVTTADRPFFSFGLQNWIPEPYRLRNTHVFYASPESLAVTLADTTVSYGFLLYLDPSATPQQGFQEIVRYLWKEYGAGEMQNPRGPQTKPFSTYIRQAWYELLPKISLDAEYKGTPVTLLRQARLAWSNGLHKAANNDNWFNVWFNALRTAYGMYEHGKNVNDEQLKSQASRVLSLALLAPQKNGIAPSIFYLDSTGGHWVADHAWGGIAKGDYLPMFHTAWTCTWMLKWIDHLPERKQEILKFTGAFADFLLANQRPNGVIPSWYHPETLVPAAEFRDENAETAGAALFLAEYSKHSPEHKYCAAAERAMHYIATEILPEHKWFDFETFFSCSRKPLGFYDSYTQQHPQNTLSMHQAAEAWYELYVLTHKEEYKNRGIEILDYLCLYQQAWSPAWLSCELFGGFGVQNTDAEWSDSRQGYFAVTLIKYYELTGRREYFERGIAALRAMFSLFESPTSPQTAENYAHSATDRLAGATGIHWGTGSSVVSIHLISKQYGDAYVNVKDQWGVGIDGCRIPAVRVKGNVIDVDLLDNLALKRSIRITVDRTEKKPYELIVNGKSYGVKSQIDLRKGIQVEL
ncbi:MAG: hypothetical protein V1799_16925 [bacterium]